MARERNIPDPLALAAGLVGLREPPWFPRRPWCLC